MTRAALILVCAIIVLPDVGTAGEVISFYSTTNKKCVAVLEDSELEKDQEIDQFTHLCSGYGGYELIHHGVNLIVRST